MFGPDLPVLGVVGGLRAAGRVAHPQQRLGGVRGAGDFQAQSLARIGEPAVVADTEVQGLRLRLEDALDAPVVDDGDRPGVVPLQGLVDGFEGADEVAGALAAGQDAALVVLVGGDGQPQVFGFFLGGDFGGEGGLVSAGAGGFGDGDGPVHERARAQARTGGGLPHQHAACARIVCVPLIFGSAFVRTTSVDGRPEPGEPSFLAPRRSGSGFQDNQRC
jgi:hypothetical protein